MTTRLTAQEYREMTGPSRARARDRARAISFLLPYPPSWNSLYGFRGKQVYRMPEYKAWIKLAGQEIQAQCVPRNGIEHPVMIDARVGAPDNRRRDLDNVTKAVGDIVQNTNIIKNDAQIHRWEVYWSSDVVNGVLVTIIPMAAEAA